MALPLFMIAQAVLGAAGQHAQGKAQQRAKDYAAAQLDAAAVQDVASAMRGAAEERRRAGLVISRAQAQAGGAAGDESVMRNLADIYGEGEYRALTALFEGEERARGRRTQAEGLRYEGRMAKKAGNFSAFMTLAGSKDVRGGVSSLYEKYSAGLDSNLTEYAGKAPVY